MYLEVPIEGEFGEEVFADGVGAVLRYARRYRIRQAAEVVTALTKLDREAVELGLEPTFQKDELRWVKDDIQTKYNYFAANRDRRR